MIILLTLITATSAYPPDLSYFRTGKTLPPYGIPVVSPPAEKEVEIEEIIKKLSLDKSWPFDKEIELEKESGYGKELEYGKELGYGKELEYGKLLGLGKFGLGELESGKELEFSKELASLSKIAGFEKTLGLEKSYFQRSNPFPWALYEKYFGLSRRLTFEQAMLFELYKQYGYYGLWVAKELKRRFSIAKELGLIGREIAFQEAISLGLFRGIGLEKIFEAVNRAIGAEKTFESDSQLSFFKF
ncbi:hypothetical protein JTE90_020424 [Oedothorax gibbosus]|uniref:Uncharacterized protein n=1 Tax=Oedothorax gibbosus TaxID=931172 RepID=A0AAV6UE62_9ARAC|nr:hypothetical protein JTE90_020424 [Oedothorax gibbosus]